MRIKSSTITWIYSVLGTIGFGFYFFAGGDYGYLVGLGVIVIAATAGVTLTTLSNKQSLDQMRILVDQTGFTLLPGRTPMPGSTPSGLFGLSSKADQWPESADFAAYFDGFRIGEKRSVGPAVYGTDSNGITWFLLNYEYTNSSYHGVSRHFAVVLARTNLVLPAVAILRKQDKGLTLADLNTASEPVDLSCNSQPQYIVKSFDQASANHLLSADFISALMRLPQYDWSFNGPFIMATIYDDDQAVTFLGMKSGIEAIIAVIPENA